MTFGRWLAGLAGVGLVLAAAWLCARAARRRLAPSLTGAVAVLADAVLTLSAVTLVLQLLGIVGLLEGWAVVAIALPALVLFRGETEGDSPHLFHRGSLVIAAVVGGVVFAAWLRRTLVALDLGIGGVDSLWYHLPFAARFAQEGSIAGAPYVDLEFLTAFYPANVELLHAGGMLAFGNDALSPWLNLAFLALGLLAGWCVGAVRGAGPAGLIGAAVVFAVPAMFESQAGEAKNDAFALATLLAAAALLLAGRRADGADSGAGGAGPGDRAGGVEPAGGAGGAGGAGEAGVAVLAGLAAGLALGSKLSFLAPVGALTVAVVVLAPARRRLTTAAAWAAGLLATSGVWFARNLALTGNPLPWLDLGPLPNPAEARSADTADPLSDYLLDGDAWTDVFLPGLESALGPAWWAILALAAAGAALAMLDRDRTVRALGVVAVVAAAAYVVTPSTAAGPEGRPIGFPLNVRYLTPALLFGLCLLAVARPRRRAGLAVAAALTGVLLATQFADPIWAFEHRRKAIAAVAVGLLLAGAAVTGRLPRAAVAVLGVVAVLASWPLVRDFDRQAHTATRLPYTAWAAFGLDEAFAWARRQDGARIAVTGTTGAFFQYPLTGRELQNEVRLLGERGPHGSFTPLRSCAAFRRALDGFTHVVITPDLDIWDPYRPLRSRERTWLAGTGARTEVPGERVTVYALPPRPGAVPCARP